MKLGVIYAKAYLHDPIAEDWYEESFGVINETISVLGIEVVWSDDHMLWDLMEFDRREDIAFTYLPKANILSHKPDLLYVFGQAVPSDFGSLSFPVRMYDPQYVLSDDPPLAGTTAHENLVFSEFKVTHIDPWEAV